MEIFNPTSSFEFHKISLATPQPITGGCSYFTKINYEDNKPVYIQLPKCLTKQSIISTKKGKYCDLMYDRANHAELIDWIEKIESSCQDRIDEKKQLWFQNEFTRDDIETMMTPIARMYKSGSSVLIRAYMNENKYTGKDKCIVYNEHEVNIDINAINEETYIIPLILLDGIKFTSRSFEIDIKIVQIMVLDKKSPEISACLIKHSQILAPAPGEVPSQVQVPSHVPIEVPSHVPIEVPSQVTVPIESAPLSTSTPLENIEIEEVQISYKDLSDSIIIKKRNEVYYEQYKLAKQKARELRDSAVKAFLEAKGIKTQYKLDDESADSDLED
jgi:hypothetical protein